MGPGRWSEQIIHFSRDREPPSPVCVCAPACVKVLSLDAQSVDIDMLRGPRVMEYMFFGTCMFYTSFYSIA